MPSFIVFLVTIFVVIIVSTTILFPAFIVRIAGGYPDYSNINPFEPGIWTYYFVVTNLILLAVAILCFKNKVPIIKNAIRFILNFEVSKKVAFLTITILVSSYIALTVHELFEEEKWVDYAGAKLSIQTWTISSISKAFLPHVKFFLDIVSMNVFGNYRVMPFLASISLLVLVYFITKEITQKRFAGIVALVLVLQSNSFLTYDTSVTYDYYWALFYLLSLYMIYKLWPLSPVSLVLSLFSKPLSAIFVPMTLFVTWRSAISKKRKFLITISHIAIIALAVIAIVYYNHTGMFGQFDWHKFWMALSGFSYQLRSDGIILMFLLSLIVGLYLRSKDNVHADSAMILILGVILSQPLAAATTVISSEPYRFIMLVVFFAIGVGVLLSKPKLVEVR